MKPVKKHSKVGIVCCSNGLKLTQEKNVKQLEETLYSLDLEAVFGNHIYAKDSLHSGTAKERAKALMDFYEDNSIKAIFDISGGDLANGVLPYLNYDIIKDSDKL